MIIHVSCEFVIIIGCLKVSSSEVGATVNFHCMLFMDRIGTIIIIVVVALLCMSCIILCQCVERGESRFRSGNQGFKCGDPI